MRISALILTLGLSNIAMAQSAPKTPQPSPKAQVMQTVGLTEITVSYSSPGAKGRKIWGELVPYNQVWRTGANAATTVSFSQDVLFAGKKVKAGTYSLYTRPAKGAWTVMLNSKTDSWGTNGYEPKRNVAAAKIKPVKAPARERMTFLFSNTTDEGTHLDLEWAELRLSMPIKVDTKKHVLSSIDEALDRAWRSHYSSARYMLDHGGDLKKALGWIDTSIAIQAHWANLWVKAQLLSKLGRSKEALDVAKKAQKLGNAKKMPDFYKKRISKAIQDWQKAS